MTIRIIPTQNNILKKQELLSLINMSNQVKTHAFQTYYQNKISMDFGMPIHSGELLETVTKQEIHNLLSST